MDRITDAPVPVNGSKIVKVLPANTVQPAGQFYNPQDVIVRPRSKAEKSFRKQLSDHVSLMNPVVSEWGWRFCLRRLPDASLPYGALVIDCLDARDALVRQILPDEFLTLTPDTIKDGGFFVNQQC